MKAVLSRDSPAAVLLYVDLYIEGVLGRGRYAVDTWHVGHELAAYVQKFPQLRVDPKRRYEALDSGPARVMLERLFGEVGDDDDLIAMVRKYAASGQNLRWLHGRCGSIATREPFASDAS
jgi:hypothetical protein